MTLNLMFFINSIFLGIGLAMDAFSVSMANGLNEPNMSRKKTAEIAGVFGFFQALMPMIGWICVHTIVVYFRSFETLIPWIALILLCFIGGKMLFDGISQKGTDESDTRLTIAGLMVQGIATSIDALSVGFTIADYDFGMALLAAVIIAVVTFIICIIGLKIGKKFGTKLSDKAQIFGGIILIAIGFEIFISGVI